MRAPLLLCIKRSFSITSIKCWNVKTYPDLDMSYLCNESNLNNISTNVIRRKGIGNIKLIHELKRKLDYLRESDTNYEEVRNQLYTECKKIPNKTHPSTIELQENPREVTVTGGPRQFAFKPLEFHEIGKKLNLIRTEQLGNLVGNRSYYLLGELAELEHALVQYTLTNLIKKQFELITVPDILHRDLIESCGLDTKGERTQVYQLEDRRAPSDLCLSGTSEMALAGYLMNTTLPIDDLPVKLAAVSRCYRAETSSIAEEKGIFRVHEFTKVEIFIATKEEDSDNTLEEIKTIEEELFGNLGLHLRTLEMPPHELGAPAYKKYDIEAWMPGRKMYGEVSSCSNCTDYQSRRLNIKYTGVGEPKYVHTLNGTACAIPRMLIAIIETYQNDNGTITVPSNLRKFLGNKEFISRQKKVPELKLIKNKKQ